MCCRVLHIVQASFFVFTYLLASICLRLLTTICLQHPSMILFSRSSTFRSKLRPANALSKTRFLAAPQSTSSWTYLMIQGSRPKKHKTMWIRYSSVRVSKVPPAYLLRPRTTIQWTEWENPLILSMQPIPSHGQSFEQRSTNFKELGLIQFSLLCLTLLMKLPTSWES
jgi:hypothetical protein